MDEDDLNWFENWRKLPRIVNQFHGNFCSKILRCREIKSVFRDVKWCFNASWGPKRLICHLYKNEGEMSIQLTGLPDVLLQIVHVSNWYPLEFEGRRSETQHQMDKDLAILAIGHGNSPQYLNEGTDFYLLSKYMCVKYTWIKQYIQRQVPSKHNTLKQCWLNVGPPSATLAQH